MAETAIWNFKQLAHHELDGFGGIGEGMSICLLYTSDAADE